MDEWHFLLALILHCRQSPEGGSDPSQFDSQSPLGDDIGEGCVGFGLFRVKGTGFTRGMRMGVVCVALQPCHALAAIGSPVLGAIST